MYRLYKYSILGMSKAKIDIKASLEESARPQIRHLIKIYLFPRSRLVSHWRSEVYNFLFDVPRMRSNKKYPSSEFIFKSTFDSNKNRIDTMYRNVSKDYESEEIFKEGTLSEITMKIETFYRWLSDNLSKFGEVSRTDMYRMLESLEL